LAVSLSMVPAPCQVGTGFSRYGRAQLGKGFEYVSEPMKRMS
jgi:hypothetical protein